MPYSVGYDYIPKGGVLRRWGRVGLGGLILPNKDNLVLPVRGLRPPAEMFGATGAVGRPAPTGAGGTVGAQTVNSGQTVSNKLITGNVTINDGGQVLDCIINGKVTMNGVSFIENCLVEYGSTAGLGNADYVIKTSSAVKATIRYCTIRPSSPSMWLTGIGPRKYLAEFNDVSYCVDGFAAFATVATPATLIGAEIYNNHVHKFYRLATGVSYQSDGMTHNDDIQAQYGFGVTAIGNWFQAYTALDVGDPITTPNGQLNSAVLMVNNNGGGVTTGIIFDRNWCDGGQFAVNAGASVGDLTARDNVFDRGAQLHADGNTYALAVDSAQSYTLSGNVYDDGTAVIRRPA